MSMAMAAVESMPNATYIKWLVICALVILVDQGTKIYAESMLAYGDPVSVFTGFNFTLLHNKGAAFSFLSNAGGWQRWFFTALSSIVSIMLFIWLKKTETHKIALSLGLTLILAGALGNLIDRVAYGYVIDFIQVYYFDQGCIWGFSPSYFLGQYVCNWPAFNIADSSIFIGAACLIIDIYRNPNH